MEFDGLPILVAGDVMLDHYISGTAARISPEAPVPVVSKRNAWSVPGGAANVARGLARLGCDPALIGLAGEDAAGDTLKLQTAAEGIRLGLVRTGRRQTTCKTRILAAGQQLLRVDEETSQQPDLEEKVSMRAHLDALLPDSRAIILSDYGKGALLPSKDGENLCQTIIAQARDLNIPVLVDPKGVDWDRYAGASCITPNTGEFIRICETLGWFHGGGEPGAVERQALAEALCRRFAFSRLLLTRGPRGMALYKPGDAPINIRAVAREVADVSGAGDTVIAVLAACVGTGESWRRAAELANAAAGIAVGKLGTAPVSAAELQKAVCGAGESQGLYSRSELAEKLAQWRQERQKIVFTNGCFDILHPGHVASLSEAASFGDRLIVGLNTDASVRRLKGGSRPIQDERSRARILGALQAVDAVVLFGEDTPEDLIRFIRPDILVKGDDYRIEDVAGADFVQSYGGQVRLVKLLPGHSTTSLETKIKAGGHGDDSHS